MEFAVVIDERDKMPAYAETYAPISKIKEKNLDAWINEFELMLERIERNA